MGVVRPELSFPTTNVRYLRPWGIMAGRQVSFMCARTMGQEAWPAAPPKHGVPIMKRFLTVCMVLSLAIPFAGCDKKAEVKKTTTVSTPEGTTTKTDTSTIKTSGDNAPAAVK
jgi:hypothetical protein